MDATHSPITGSVFLRRVLLVLSVIIGVPGLAVLIFGVSHGALMFLAPLFLLLVAGGIVLGICTVIVGGVLATNPAHRTRANCIALAVAFLASAVVLIPAFVGP